MRMHKPLVATIIVLLILNQSAYAAFNMLDEPELDQETLKIGRWATYEKAPSYQQVNQYAPASYRSSYRQAVYDPNDLPRAESVVDSQIINSDGVIEVGFSDASPSIIKRSGNDKPLSTALRSILPKGWFSRKQTSVSRKMLVSWESGWDWVTTLDDLGKEYGLSMIVDWNSQTVTIAKVSQRPRELIKNVGYQQENIYTATTEQWEEIKPKQKTESALQPLPSTSIAAAKSVKNIDRAASTPSTPITQLSTATPVVIASPAQSIKFDPPLHLVSGQKMSESLESWAKAIGWNLVWEAKVDYPISVNTTLLGSADEIITKFGDALVHSHLPLHVDVFRLNKVIRVSNQ